MNTSPAPNSVFGAYMAWWTKVAPPGVSEIQTVEMRRAFYSGGYSLFLMLCKIAKAPEKKAMAGTCKLHDEFIAFIEDMMDMAQEGDTVASRSTGDKESS